MKQLLYNVINKYLSLFKIIFTLALVMLLANDRVNAQNELDVIRNNWLQYSNAPNSLYNHIAGQAYDLLARRAAKIDALSSLSDWQQRQKFIRETLLNIVGPFPGKAPLNAKIIRTIDKDDYRVEHIVYESQPGFYVTSSMFIPTGLKRVSKIPTIIYCSGHSGDGYRGYQTQILNLVKKGFIVFAFDPVGQGERLGYYDPETKKSAIGPPTIEHSYPGSQVFITGSSLARYMIWDGIRAVDYLLSRNEVDPARIGITGRSGGGTQSAYIAAMDDRIYAAAPECWITNFTRLFQTVGPQDAEQNFFNEIIGGIDHSDFLLVRAPKPTLMITTTRDMFSIQGAKETENVVSRIYKAYGKEDNFSRVEDDFPHASTKKNREAMYAFFQKYLNNPGNSNDEIVKTLTAEELQVTPTGQVSTSLGGETIFSLNRKEAEKLVINLQTSRNDLTMHLQDVLNSAKKLSGYLKPTEINEPVFTGRFQREGYVIEKYFLKGEGNYVIPYLLLIPSKPNNKALIYLHPSGKSVDASVGGDMEWFVSRGYKVLAPDLIGIGEMGPGDFKGDAYIEGVSHNIWYASILIGRSIVGIRTGDVVRLTRLLKEDREISEVYGIAKKEMAPVLLHAAAFDLNITRIALIEPYSSYQSIVMNHFYDSSFIHGVVPGALRAYDLPDLAASLAPRKLIMAGVTDGYGKNADTESINKDIEIIKIAYQAKEAKDKLNIISDLSPKNKYDIFENWIK
ncbi:MAG: acetylxylan esterase [Lentimicrobiaceae bacterium]|nr:acetylxylan esterase [Lentimicrobiaceae bacterium]